MKDVLPDMSKGYSDKLESKACGLGELQPIYSILANFTLAALATSFHFSHFSHFSLLLGFSASPWGCRRTSSCS
jgi:hypothetical protein